MSKRKQSKQAPLARTTGTATQPGEPIPIEESGDLAAEEVALILAERTRSLAAIPPHQERGESIDAAIFALGKDTCAIEVKYVDGIFPLEGLTPTPCTPDFVAGVINLRGRVLSIIDLHRFLGLEPIQVGPRAQVIAVSAAGLEIGILTNKVYAVRPILIDDLKPALPTSTHFAAEFTRGVTSNMIVCLNLEDILKDERMVVREEVR